MLRCKKCDCTEYTLKPDKTGKHMGLYCAQCGFWHKWIPKTELHHYEGVLNYNSKAKKWAANQDWKLIEGIYGDSECKEYAININGVRFAISDFYGFENGLIELVAKHRI